MSGLPFFEITMVAVVAHLSSLIFGIIVEAVFNAGGWMRGWGKAAQTIPVFTASRSEVRFAASWVAIFVAQAAICIAGFPCYARSLQALRTLDSHY